MVTDCLKLATSHFNFRDIVKTRDIKRFCKLDDTVLREINRDESGDLTEAQEILQRMERREIYQCVKEFQIPINESTTVTAWKKVRKSDIIGFIPRGPNGRRVVTEKDIIVHNMKVDFGKQAKNPINKVNFYQKGNVSSSFTIEPERISSMLPSNYMDHYVRVYLRRNDKVMAAAIEEACESYQEKMLGRWTQRTPAKSETLNRTCNGVEESDGHFSDLSKKRKLSFDDVAEPESRPQAGEGQTDGAVAVISDDVLPAREEGIQDEEPAIPVSQDAGEGAYDLVFCSQTRKQE